MSRRRGLIGSAKKGLLPSGYKQLEYIESTGTQWIKTGFKPNQDTKVEVDFEFNKGVGANAVFFGATGLWSNATFGFYLTDVGNTYSNYNNDTNISNYFAPVLNTRYLYVHDKQNIYVDGILKYTHAAATFQSTGNLFLGVILIRTEYAFKGKCYSFKIWDNGTLVCNFIPAKRNSDNEIGMCDIVSQTFFTNAGTGVFIPGPEI